jgi:NAD(P)-dependent dehydrogenase (short-subunit alcohol dehydrogenase family)
VTTKPTSNFPRTAIVTGGSQGLGRALTIALADQGWNVVTDARHEADLRAVADHDPDHIVGVTGDITDPFHRAALIERVERGGRLDLLVNNAGTLGPSPLPRLADVATEDLRNLFEVNVVAPLALTAEALGLLRATRGAVMNVTSDAAVEGYEGWGGYGLTKAALEQASRVLAAEEPDVAVWWVDPGDMRTAMHQAAFPGEDISDRPEPDAAVRGVVELITTRQPSGRYSAPALDPQGQAA